MPTKGTSGDTEGRLTHQTENLAWPGTQKKKKKNKKKKKKNIRLDISKESSMIYRKITA